MDRVIDVVGAVIVDGESVLCAQRGPGGALSGKWEFPGGKIEAEESARDALRREIAEELLCDIAVGDEVESTSHQYDFGIVNLTTFYCSVVEREPVATEHQQLVWRKADGLAELDWAPADLPAVARIQDDFGSRAG